MRLRLFDPLILLLVLAGSLVAQRPVPPRPVLVVADSAVQQRLVMRDGSELIGRIISIGDTTVQFQSALGLMTLRSNDIAKLSSETGGSMRNGQYYFPNPNTTRLIFAPTGRMLQAGEGYFSDYWIFFPGVSVGIASMVSIGGGMSIFPGVDLEEQLLYFTPKVGVVKTEKFNAAVGALYVTVPSFDDGAARETAGMLYGVGTWGTADDSFTAGLGYGFANDQLARSPAVLLGGEVRAAPRVSLVTENYLIPGGIMLLGGGLRFMGRGLSVDLALFAAAGEGGGGCCFPFLGFVYSWR
ncbi:MAG: hypothetical protein ACRENU_08470 [Gemmatimonadaceae bacterium]